jgi:hypothetical protein
LRTRQPHQFATTQIQTQIQIAAGRSSGRADGISPGHGTARIAFRKTVLIVVFAKLLTLSTCQRKRLFSLHQDVHSKESPTSLEYTSTRQPYLTRLGMRRGFGRASSGKSDLYAREKVHLMEKFITRHLFILRLFKATSLESMFTIRELPTMGRSISTSVLNVTALLRHRCRRSTSLLASMRVTTMAFPRNSWPHEPCPRRKRSTVGSLHALQDCTR